MKLQVEQAKKLIGKKIPFLHTGQGSAYGDVTAFPWSRHDITIQGEYWFDGQHMKVTGTISREGVYECTRCLAPVSVKWETPFAEAYRDARSSWDDEDTDCLSFDGDAIDLTELIRETLIINEPSQVLCQEDCKGLCVHCGTSLNDSPCSCETFAVDPRWAALRTLLDKKDD